MWKVVAWAVRKTAAIRDKVISRFMGRSVSGAAKVADRNALNANRGAPDPTIRRAAYHTRWNEVNSDKSEDPQRMAENHDVTPAGIEPATGYLEGSCSIH